MPGSPAGESPSLFSFVYQSPDGDTVALHDSQPARRRRFTFRMNLPSKRPPGPIRTDSTESLHTIDSVDGSSWTYKASYPSSLVEEEIAEPEAEEPCSDDWTNTLPPSKSVTWLKALQSKLLAVGRALHLCTP